MAYATATMKAAATEFENRVGAVCSGIVGDSAHNYGYHRAFNEIGSGDYSRQLAGDRVGIDPNAADAIDMSMTRDKMILVTGRFYRSWKDTDDRRLDYFREIIGTLDGKSVIYMDTQSGGKGTSDSSHLWHLHSGGLRRYTGDPNAWRAWISVAVGESWADYCRGNPGDPITRGAQPAPTPTSASTSTEDDMPHFSSHPVKTGPGHDAAGNLTPATVTEVGLPMSGSLWADRTCYLSFKADFGKAKLRYAISYDTGAGKTEWKIGEVTVDSTKPRGGPAGAGIPVPAKADGVSLFRVSIDADDRCETPVALVVEIG